ncbi:hypothetical protein [Methylobacterium sp. E-046]|uniref:hypothetical protein n=1 Tax=Methylobacterium sp. E-046 TaxID=2836576 RepID=UPI001FBB4CFD|nr:hypothetical protein [Methylobacterium sp. E-046]
MRYCEIAEPDSVPLRDPARNEAQLTVNIKDDPILLDLIRKRGDGEIVERRARRLNGVSTIYVRCADNDSAAALMEAWVPYLPIMRRPTSRMTGRTDPVRQTCHPS